MLILGRGSCAARGNALEVLADFVKPGDSSIGILEITFEEYSPLLFKHHTMSLALSIVSVALNQSMLQCPRLKTLKT